MTKKVNIQAIEKGTGKTWQEWLVFLEKRNAKALPHKEIAQLVAKDGGVSGWWAQGITAAFEQEIGRRKPGQSSSGTYQVSVNKTLDGSMDKALKSWVTLTKDKTAFSDVAIDKQPTTSKSEKFRYWHCALADGSRVSMSIYEKDSGKAVIGLGHEKLQSEKVMETWKTYWKSLLDQIS